MTGRLVIIGAGIVGSACAYFAARAGWDVVVLERDLPASGTSSRCEGNILLSDKELGPELDLARYSLDVWKGELAEFAPRWEFEAKGGVIVASTPRSVAALEHLVATQATRDVHSTWLDADALREVEPHINPAALAGALYPQDSQVQPMLAAAHLLRLARDLGAQVRLHEEVRELLTAGGRVVGVRTARGEIRGDAVLNATGTWGGSVAAMAGVRVPVLPRRGYVMVTQPLPPMIRHKVYAAEYVGDVGSADEGLQASPVVEGTPAGSILIGSSRERVGFESAVSTQALGRIARNAAALFPFLTDVRIIRHYHGFRPYCPDHLPVIGHDDRAPGLWHACGHEGAGIGLSVGTAKLLVQALGGQEPDLDLSPFAPARFGTATPQPEGSAA
jgi:glycine/D-amino acid oxidase-like deaminating enzyme